MGIVEQFVSQLNTEKQRFRRITAVMTVLSVLVGMSVTWNLRQTGMTIANDASCGQEEHRHSAECPMEKVLICGYGSIELPESPTEETVQAPTEETVQAPTEETVQAPTEETVQAPTEETVQAPTEETVQAPTEETVQAPTEETVQAPTEETVQAPTEETVQSPVEEVTLYPEEEVTQETPGEVTEETQSENPLDVVMNVAAEVLSGVIPTARATEITAEDPTEENLQEHVHTEECYEIVWLCGLEEHLHDISCYSDITADLESWDIWSASVPELTGNISEDIVLVAQSQLGNRESSANFELAEDGQTRKGITRYGQWYGNPYGDWSNMFTSFCLRYAGLAKAPVNSGAEKMRQEWEKLELYRHAAGYEPTAGDIVFLDKNQNGTVETTAVVVSYFDFILTVIEGDVDNSVAQQEYRIDDPVIVGYGLTNPAGQLLMAAGPADSAIILGQAVTYSEDQLVSGDAFVLYTAGTEGRYYALNGDGEAVEVWISNTGEVTAEVSDQRMLFWEFEQSADTEEDPTYYIRNVATGLVLRPNEDDNTSGLLLSDKQDIVLYSRGSEAEQQGESQDAWVQLSDGEVTLSDMQDSGSVFYLAKAPATVTLWLDGTNGGLTAYNGSDNTKYTVYSGEESQLPSTWKIPTKYHYVLAGWVNVKNGDYYLPGSSITITENTVLYADWVAATYDIGQYNPYVANTVSTNDFITTHVFDYSSLINLNSAKVSVTVSDTSHSESWSHVATGNVSFQNRPTLDFSFNDQDGSGDISNLNSRNKANTYTGGTGVYAGIYTTALGNALFGTDNLFDPETGEGIVGKHYLGQGDHLFQINTDPTSEYYGYYYYDAKLNAASYNQSEQRFFVYDYLARTSDSANNNDAGKYSDFLPLNSPHANTNGQTLKTYSYQGENGEYNGVSHYTYDVSYSSSGTASNQIRANLWFGMRTDIQFGLPDTPGVKLSNGEYGNKDIYGNDMHFHFTGDDDVWILVDGKVALDLGGIHQAADGDINFSTGEVRVNGKSAGELSGIGPGEHTLSILYLERGSSMSNCAIYFNLAPRFSLTLSKEDVLTQEILNGAQFGVYNNLACTEPCNLWTSQQSYKNGDEPTHQFTIENGKAYIWGLSPSRIYYIREELPPNASGYLPAKGVIQLTLDKNGLNSDSATILEDPEGKITNGFTIHGFRIDEENQTAYLTVTNAQNWVKETTSVYVEKKWNDKEDHTYDSVTVYLNVTDPDGTVRRIREISLSEENDWKYTWANLPKYTLDAETMTESKNPVQYSVSEAYIPGYMNQVTVLESGTYTEITWPDSGEFTNGDYYLLKTSKGCISAVSKDKDTLKFVDEATAKDSPLALWKATVSGSLVKLTNQEGQTLNYYSSGWTRYFNVTTNSTTSQNLTPTEQGTGFRLAYKSSRTSYYMTATLNSKGYIEAKSQSSSALTVNLIQKTTTTTTLNIEGVGYRITNTPLTTETSLKVTKRWSHEGEDASIFEKAQVTMKLMANGVYTGRTETVSLKSNWTAVFNGLPYVDEEGNPIVYTVEESWETEDWIVTYGPITTISGETPNYETIVTNSYRWKGDVVLPSTGGTGTPLLILSGLILVSAPLVYGLSLRRRYRKEAKESSDDMA